MGLYIWEMSQEKGKDKKGNMTRNRSVVWWHLISRSRWRSGNACPSKTRVRSSRCIDIRGNHQEKRNGTCYYLWVSSHVLDKGVQVHGNVWESISNEVIEGKRRWKRHGVVLYHNITPCICWRLWLECVPMMVWCCGVASGICDVLTPIQLATTSQDLLWFGFLIVLLFLLFTPSTWSLGEAACAFPTPLIFSLVSLMSFPYLCFPSSSLSSYLGLWSSLATSPMTAGIPHIPSYSFPFFSSFIFTQLGPCLFPILLNTCPPVQ